MARFDLTELRRRRLEQLEALTDDLFAAEVRAHQAATWRRSALFAHAKKHWNDFERLVGHGLAPSELEALSSLVLESWDRLFTGVRPVEGVTYVFAAGVTDRGGILVVVARGKWIRTAMPMTNIDAWLNRHSDLVEVTERARRLGL